MTVYEIFDTVVIVFTSIIVIWQVRLMEIANSASAFSIIFEILQSDKIRDARFQILNTNEPYSNWPADLKKQAEQICNTYDMVGILLKRKVVPYPYVVEGWHDSIKKCWEKSKDMISEQRSIRGNDVWGNFETLYEKSIEFEKCRTK